MTFNVSAADIVGVYTLCEAIEPPDAAVRLHRHPTYDETHIICEGHYECQLGDAKPKLGPGEMMFAPCGTPHIKSVSPETGRELIISSARRRVQCVYRGGCHRQGRPGGRLPRDRREITTSSS